MTVVMVVSLVVIGAVTIFFFTAQNEQYHRDRLERKERAIKTEMAYFSQEVELQDDADVVVKEFEEEVRRLSIVHNMEVNVFNTQGDLLITARPDTNNAHFILRTVPATILDSLRVKDRLVIHETDGDRPFMSDYTVLRNAKGEPIAILNLPYIEDESLNQADLIDFLQNIGVTYLFLFIGAILVTLAISNTITKDIRVLSERIQSTDFSQPNEPLVWHRNDEIGMLVKAYNNMLKKLEESRELLARKERESAWREMARQVAHEIKNPLTPIKLSIQHLQATSRFDDPKWREKFDKTMSMVIKQTEMLSAIASEFSDFAKMPKYQPEMVEVSKVISDVELLFADAPFELSVMIDPQDLRVNIDPNSLVRVLNNLVKNAKHAVADTEKPKVVIRAFVKENSVVIEVSDNGVGIKPEFHDKIFQPNFTTKSGGTGLGLAICKQIIEQAGGKITFESIPGSRTTFTVVLPNQMV
ncbi:MAG: HAMP domain-containing sensor histidine kinase [Salibacteraceae bacterium]